MKKINLHITTDIDTALTTKTPGYIRDILKGSIKLLEHYTNGKVTFSVPEQLQKSNKWNLDSKPIVNILNSLQSLGVVTDLVKKGYYHDEPKFFSYKVISPLKHISGSGSDLLDEEKASWKALGEFVERYLWLYSDFFSQSTVTGTYKKLQKNALDIFSFVGFSEKQRKENPELGFTEDTTFGWTPVYSLTTNEQKLCPVQLISASYAKKNGMSPLHKNGIEPMLRWTVSTGLAVGQTKEEAIVAGILESIERDAFMITYLNRLSPDIINLHNLAKQDKDIERVLEKFKRYCLNVYVVTLPTDFPVFINLAIIIDHTKKGPAVSMGASADFDLKASVLDALSESISVRIGSRKMHKKPANDLSNMDRKGRLIYWSEYKNIEKLDFLLQGKEVNVDINASRKQKTILRYTEAQLNTLIEEFKNKNMEVYYANLATKEVKELGLHAVNVIVPKLQPMHLQEIVPYKNGERLKIVPKKMGFNPAQKINTEPHPFP